MKIQITLSAKELSSNVDLYRMLNSKLGCNDENDNIDEALKAAASKDGIVEANNGFILSAKTDGDTTVEITMPEWFTIETNKITAKYLDTVVDILNIGKTMVGMCKRLVEGLKKDFNDMLISHIK